MTNLADRLLALPEREASDLFLTEVCGWEHFEKEFEDHEDGSTFIDWAWKFPNGKVFRACDIHSIIPNPFGDLQEAWECLSVDDEVQITFSNGITKVRLIAVVDRRDNGDICTREFTGEAPTPSAALCLAIAGVKNDEQKD